MIIIREPEEMQVAKLESTVTTAELESQNALCPGECWDCDSCGGSATH